MSYDLGQLNRLSEQTVRAELMRCCTSAKWITGMIEHRPFSSKETVFRDSDIIWNSLEKSDWLEAFAGHPRIGDVDSLAKKFPTTSNWAKSEQSAVKDAAASLLVELADFNARYEEKFGYIFIICATGKTAREMLSSLKIRLENDPEKELKIAAEEQRKIIRIRLEKLLKL